MRLTGAIARKNGNDFESAHFISGHHKVPRIWIIVTDKKVAKIFSKAGNSIKMIGEALPSEDDSDTMAKDKKTVHTTKSNGRPAHIQYEPSMSPVRRRAFRFAHEIAAWLDKALEKEAFDRLIIVAPPQTLGDLRSTVSKAVYSRLLAEINKDLTKLDEKDLQEGLERVVWF